jgi:hypothetical protein
MVSIILGAAIVAASLLLLYLLALRFPKFGGGVAFLCILAMRLLVKLQWLLEQAGSYCYQAFQKSLRYPPDVTDDVGLLGVLSRLVWLLLSSSILFGETENTFLALPSLFQVPNDVTLPGGVSIASGMLFVSCAAMYGAVVLECVGVIPYAAGLFVNAIMRVSHSLIQK